MNCGSFLFLFSSIVNALKLTLTTMVKYFACTKCGERFTEHAVYQNHLVQHQNEVPRPFVCDICPDISYTRKHKLNEHMKRHHNSDNKKMATFQCTFCTSSFLSHRDL